VKKAALYLRSSKDRKDVSIQHQRKALETFAKDRGLIVVSEYTDVVESGKSEYRPGFQRLTKDLKRPSRDWDTILLLDTSRLGRRRYIGEAFKHECAKRGVAVLFKSLPEVDPISRVILESVMSAMDEVHSLMSRDKGLAGMAENVEQGFRAGGRAPRGYTLRRIQTGVMREGAPVSKSVLEPGPDAAKVGEYLQLRAARATRAEAKRAAGVTWADTSLIGMEWNALTYAGHTVWNVHNETNPGGGYKGGTKRRPRDQWHIKRDTHPPLITEAEAEAILHQLEHSEVGRAVSRAKRGLSAYLLTGVLQAPDGRQWIGQRDRYYRLRAGDDTPGRQVMAQEVDQLVLGKIRRDFTRDQFLDALLRAARRQAAGEDVPDLQAEILEVSRQIDRAMEIAMEMRDPSPAIRKADALEARRRELVAEAERHMEQRETRKALEKVNRDDLARILTDVLERMDDREALKGLIGSVVERVELCPATLQCALHYRIPVRLCVASPRGFEPRSPP
jgi:site-specific DNA recombinase